MGRGGNGLSGGVGDMDPVGDQSRDRMQQFLRDTAGRMGIGPSRKASHQATKALTSTCEVEFCYLIKISRGLKYDDMST